MTTEPANARGVLSDDHILEAAYDIFLSLAADNLTPADQLLFTLQFEKRGAAELYSPDKTFWSAILTEEKCIDDDHFAEVSIGLTDEEGAINDIFARLLLSRDATVKACEIIWKV